MLQNGEVAPMCGSRVVNDRDALGARLRDLGRIRHALFLGKTATTGVRKVSRRRAGASRW